VLIEQNKNLSFIYHKQIIVFTIFSHFTLLVTAHGVPIILLHNFAGMNKRGRNQGWNEDFFKAGHPKGLFSVVTPLSKSKPPPTKTKKTTAGRKPDEGLKKLKQEVEEILPKLHQLRNQNLTSSSKIDRVNEKISCINILY
jgi:hypothetical protein